MLGHVLLGGALESQRVEVNLVANPAQRCDCDKEEGKWDERGDCRHLEVGFDAARCVEVGTYSAGQG